MTTNLKKTIEAQNEWFNKSYLLAHVQSCESIAFIHGHQQYHGKTFPEYFALRDAAIVEAVKWDLEEAIGEDDPIITCQDKEGIARIRTLIENYKIGE